MIKCKKRIIKYLSFGVFIAVLSIFSTSCKTIKNLKDLVGEIKVEADSIGNNLGAGLVNGIDSDKLDSLVARIANTAGNGINNELDSISFHKLQESLSTALTGVLKDAENDLEKLLADTTMLDSVDYKVQSILDRAGKQIDDLLSNLIPNALSDENLDIIKKFKNEILGPDTAKRLGDTLKSSLKDVLKDITDSEELDSLIRKIATVIDTTKQQVDDTVFKVDKTIARIGGILLAVILGLTALFLVLWLRKQSQNRQQKELLVKLTKAIDAIPDQRDYDHTVAYVQDQISDSRDIKQRKILDDILQEYKGQYPQKEKYEDYQQRLIDYLKNRSRDRSLAEDDYSDISDEAFRNYVREVMNS